MSSPAPKSPADQSEKSKKYDRQIRLDWLLIIDLFYYHICLKALGRPRPGSAGGGSGVPDKCHRLGNGDPKGNDSARDWWIHNRRWWNRN